MISLKATLTKPCRFPTFRFLRKLARRGRFKKEEKPSGQGEDLRLEVASHFQFPIGGIAREGGKNSGEWLVESG